MRETRGGSPAAGSSESRERAPLILSKDQQALKMRASRADLTRRTRERSEIPGVATIREGARGEELPGRRSQEQAQRSSLPICFSYLPFFSLLFFFHLFNPFVLFLTEHPSRDIIS